MPEGTHTRPAHNGYSHVAGTKKPLFSGVVTASYTGPPSPGRWIDSDGGTIAGRTEVVNGVALNARVLQGIFKIPRICGFFCRAKTAARALCQGVA